jgi:hypothetical protein
MWNATRYRLNPGNYPGLSLTSRSAHHFTIVIHLDHRYFVHMINTGSEAGTVGIEFLKLTHWERYLLNQFISKLECELLPDACNQMGGTESDEVWRGNRRRHYRLDTSGVKLEVKLDFRPSNLAIVAARLVNLSPNGCCVLKPDHVKIEANSRIPRLQLNLGEDTITCRARVIFINNGMDQG